MALYFKTLLLIQVFLCLASPVQSIKHFKAKNEKSHQEDTKYGDGYELDKGSFRDSEGHFKGSGEKSYTDSKEHSFTGSQEHSFTGSKEHSFTGSKEHSFSGSKEHSFTGSKEHGYGTDDKDIEQSAGVLSHLESLKEGFISDLSSIKDNFRNKDKGPLKDKYTGKGEENTDTSGQEQPACPIRIKPTYEEAIVEQVQHTVVTVNTEYDATNWEYVTETVTYPVTVTEFSTITQPPLVINITETVVIPEGITGTDIKMVTVDHTLVDTSLSIITYTMTNTMTTTHVKPEYVTVTKHSTKWITRTNPVDITTTEWVSSVTTIVQPAYITTRVSVDAPSLVVVTSTEIHPHYMTNTAYVTKMVTETICTE